MKRVATIVLVVLAGASAVRSQAATAPEATKAKAKAGAYSGFGRHAATIAWVAGQFDAARKAPARQKVDALLAKITARIETALSASPAGTDVGDRLGRFVLTAWQGRIKGCELVRLHAWRLAVGQGDQGDRQAVLAATDDVFKPLRTRDIELNDLKFESRKDMRVWIVSKTDFELVESLLYDACARVSFCRGLALGAGVKRTQAFECAIAYSQKGTPGTPVSRRGAVLAGRCHLALGRGDKALAGLKPLLAAKGKPDASVVRARMLAGRCARAAGNVDEARAYLVSARTGLTSISQPALRALVDAEITICAQSLASGKIDPGARGAELAAFAKRNGTHGDVLAAMLGLSGWSGGALLGPALAGTDRTRHSVAFWGTSTPADDVVYVVDRSGSMVTVFDYVRLLMQVSIGGLRTGQRFHIVLFADEKTLEGPGKGLVSARPNHKVNTVEFLERDEVRPRGRTTALVALKRAFAVLDEEGKTKRLKTILIMTDGEFAGSGGGSRYKGMKGNEAVLAWLKANNADGRVVVNTVLFVQGASDRAVKVMKQVAAEHGGKFRAINPDE